MSQLKVRNLSIYIVIIINGKSGYTYYCSSVLIAIFSIFPPLYDTAPQISPVYFQTVPSVFCLIHVRQTQYSALYPPNPNPPPKKKSI